MSTHWARLGSPDAISRITLIVVALIQTTGSFITSRVEYSGRVPEFLLVRACALLVLGCVLFGGRLLLKSKLPAALKPVITTVFVVLATIASVVTDDTLLQVTQFTTESRLAARLALSLVGLPIAMIVTGLIVTALREQSRQNQTMLLAAEELLATRTQAAERIAARRSHITQRINAEINTELAHLDSASWRISPEDMKSLLDDVIRPLSYELKREGVREAVEPTHLPASRVAWKDVFVATVNGQPFHPIAAAAWPTATTTSFVTANFGPIGLLLGAAFFAVCSVLMWLCALVWNRVSDHLTTASKTVLLALSFGFVAWLATWVLKTSLHADLFAGERDISWIVVCEVFFWTIALLFTANALLHQTSEALGRTVEELQREVVSLNTANRHLQRGISRILHGPVQHAIAASIYQLQATPDAATDQTVLSAVRQRISAALDLLSTSEHSAPNLREAFSELTELWANVSPIAFQVSDTDLALIQRDDHAAHATHELVGEACMNAMKHGEAGQITVAIEVNRAERLIEISVQNTGKPLVANPRTGLGSQLLDEMCISWSRSQRGDLVVTEMTLPIQL